MIDKLGHHAAIALRDAIEVAIANMESRIKGEPPSGPHRDYFVKQMAEFKAAITELRFARGEAHRRVFETIQKTE